MYSFSYLEPVCYFMSSSNCCFLTCIHISLEADLVVWYSHLLKNFPQFIVIHSVNGFGIVNKPEIDVFLELSCFFYDYDSDNHDDVITHLEPHILECKVSGLQEASLQTKIMEVMEFQLGCFKS